MKFSILTYNVLFNKAFLKLEGLLNLYQPDIVCLQEVDTNEANLSKLESLKYKLADYSNSFIKFDTIYGVATYFNSQRFDFHASDAFFLPRSLYESASKLINIFKGENKPRTVLRVDLLDKSSKKQLLIFNVHLSAYASNGARLKNLKQALEPPSVKTGKPTIIAGDFNYYPYGRKRFEEFMLEYDLKEATINIPYTMKYSSVRKLGRSNLLQKLSMRLHELLFDVNNVKFDYIFYKNLKIIKTDRIDNNQSDHYPILSTFEL